MTKVIYCWRCGESLKNLILPLSRREECAECGAEQHVCKLCKNNDPRRSSGCNEDLAEDILDKESANFCDYFAPSSDAYQQKGRHKLAKAESELAELFDNESSNITPNKAPTSQTKKDNALSELEDLFGNGKKK